MQTAGCSTVAKGALAVVAVLADAGHAVIQRDYFCCISTLHVRMLVARLMHTPAQRTVAVRVLAGVLVVPGCFWCNVCCDPASCFRC